MVISKTFEYILFIYFNFLIKHICFINNLYGLVFRSKFSYSNSKSSYSDILKDIDSGNIESIFFYPRQREIDVLYKNGEKIKIPILYNDQLILEKATENKVEITINNSRKEALAAKVSFLLLLIVSSTLFSVAFSRIN